MNSVIEQEQPVATIYSAGTLTPQEARDLTHNINTQAEQLRQNLLKFDDGKGWLALGYKSFREWADKEFRYGFQHAYTLIGVARVEKNLTLTFKINVGKQYKKLKTPELQVEAHQIAMGLAKSVNATEPTEKQAQEAVEVVKKREFVRHSPHKVVAQVMESGGLSADEGIQIAKLLNASPPQTQYYVQQKMVDGVKNTKIIENIIYRHRDVVHTGKPSSNLTEMDTTKRIAGVPFDKATEKDWLRMAAENQRQLLEEKRAAKEAEEAERAKEQGIEPPPKIEPRAMNAYTNSPERTLESLKRVLDDNTLDGLAKLIMQGQGYVQSVVHLAHTDDYIDLDLIGGIPSDATRSKKHSTVELWARMK